MTGKDEQALNEWLVESEDEEGAVFFRIDSEGNKLRVRVKTENYRLIENRIFVRLGVDPEWLDPPEQCSL